MQGPTWCRWHAVSTRDPPGFPLATLDHRLPLRAFMAVPALRSILRTPLRSVLFIGSFIAATVSTAQSAQHLIAKGDSLLQLEKPQRAMEFFERAVEADPSAASHLARARAWYMLDRMDRFVLDVDKALRLDSSSAEAH